MLHNRRTLATAACSGAICSLRRELCQRPAPPVRTGRDGQPGRMDDASEGLAQTAEHLPAEALLGATAHLVDSLGKIGQQIDVVALDRQDSPIAGQTIVPTESVYAVLGAKQAAKPASAGSVSMSKKQEDKRCATLCTARTRGDQAQRRLLRKIVGFAGARATRFRVCATTVVAPV
jgi:hypothetical protein